MQAQSVDRRIVHEIRQAIAAGIIPSRRVTLEKEGYILLISFPDNYPFVPPKIFAAGFKVEAIGEWSPAANLVSIWNDFTAQIGNTYDERLLLASISRSGFAFIPE
jgi:hypothetical protein